MITGYLITQAKTQPLVDATGAALGKRLHFMAIGTLQAVSKSKLLSQAEKGARLDQVIAELETALQIATDRSK